jgi:hypothetical protein
VGVEVYAVDKEEEKSVKNKPHFKKQTPKRKHSKVLVTRHRSKFKELTRNRKVGYWPIIGGAYFFGRHRKQF